MRRITGMVLVISFFLVGLALPLDSWARQDKWPYKEMVTVAAVNFTPITGDKAATLQRMKDFAVKAAKMGANIILFPELALVGIPAAQDAPKVAETIPGPSTLEMAKLAQELNVYIIFGMIERKGKDLYNAAAVVGPKGIMGAHYKVHPIVPMEPWAAKGKEYKLFETEYGPIGIGICYSTYLFPETARSYAVRGVRLFFNATAFPEFPDCSDYKHFYMTTLGCRAIENSMFVVSSNMVGKVGGIPFFGYSAILGPRPGHMSYCVFAGPASDKEEEIVLASLNLRSVEFLPMGTNTILEDRNPDVYGHLVAPLRPGR